MLLVHCCTIGSALCARQQTNVARRLSAESVEGLALALERVDDVHGRDGLAASVLSVGDRVADDVLKEDLECNNQTSDTTSKYDAGPDCFAILDKLSHPNIFMDSSAQYARIFE